MKSQEKALWDTVHPTKYARGSQFAVLYVFRYQSMLPISVKVSSQVVCKFYLTFCVIMPELIFFANNMESFRSTKFTWSPAWYMRSVNSNRCICVHKWKQITPWTSYKIRKIAGCACARNAGNVFPTTSESDPHMHHGTYLTHVPCCMLGSLTSGFPWCRWRGKRSRHSRCMRSPQFYVSGKRPLG